MYWDSYQCNADKLKNNPRLGMEYQPLARMEISELTQLRARAYTCVSTLTRSDAPMRTHQEKTNA
jgi:deoxyribodipyrimidine photolyase-like uncharacterized protein